MMMSKLIMRIFVFEKRADATILSHLEELREAANEMLRLEKLRSKGRLAEVDPAQGKDHTTIVSVGVKWIPVAERLPTEGREYLVVTEGQVTTAVWDSSGMHGCFRPSKRSCGVYPNVTHWAELPALPLKVAEGV